MKRVYKPNLVSGSKPGGDHSSRPCVTTWLKRPTRKRRRVSSSPERAAQFSFPYLALHREEFTWPRLSPATPVSSYLTVSPITLSGWSILCCTCRPRVFTRVPVVIRLAALWCSDFPLSISQKRSPDGLHYLGKISIAKNVEQTNLMLQGC